MKLIEVEWEDIVSMGGWHSEPPSETAKIVTVGYLLKETEEGVTLTQSLDLDETDKERYNNSIFIPHIVITKNIKTIRK